MLRSLLIILVSIFSTQTVLSSDPLREEPITLTLHLINRNIGEESPHNDFWQCQQTAKAAFEAKTYTFDETEYFTFKTKPEDHFGPSGFNDYGYYRYNELKLLFDVEFNTQEQSSQRKGVSVFYNPKDCIKRFFDISLQMTPEEFTKFSRYDISLSSRSLRFPERFTSSRPKVLGSMYGSGDFCVMYQDAQNGYHVFHALSFSVNNPDEIIGMTACATDFVEKYTKQTGVALTQYKERR